MKLKKTEEAEAKQTKENQKSQIAKEDEKKTLTLDISKDLKVLENELRAKTSTESPTTEEMNLLKGYGIGKHNIKTTKKA